MFPNPCNMQGTGTGQFNCIPNQMQTQNQPNMIRCQSQSQTPGFCPPHVPNCDCRTMPASNFMQPNGMNSSMMNGCQGMMPPNFSRPNQPCQQNQNQQQQQQQRMMQQMFGMQQQPQQGGQFGQNVCPNMQRNMNQNATPQQQPFNMGFNSY